MRKAGCEIVFKGAACDLNGARTKDSRQFLGWIEHREGVSSFRVAPYENLPDIGILWTVGRAHI